MAITLLTDCKKCLHHKVCKNKNHAEQDMNKLRNTRYGDGPNDDYDWNIMTASRNVNIEFSCPDFRSEISKRGGIE